MTFERRSSNLYRAGINDHSVLIRPDSLSIGAVQILFAGASASARLQGVGSASPATYLSAASRTTFLQFPKLAVRRLYPGIDAIFYGNGMRLEYDLVASPGTDLRRIRIRFAGAARLSLDAEGNLEIQANGASFTQLLPRVFEPGGRRIAASYIVLPHNEVRFRLGPHDPHRRGRDSGYPLPPGVCTF